MSTLADVVGPSQKVIEHAVVAFDNGHKLVCSWINRELEQFGTSVRIDVDSPAAGVTLDASRLALSNALVGYRPFAPELEHDEKLKIWVLFHFQDETGKYRGGIVSLRTQWGETTEGSSSENFWRNEFGRLSLHDAREWTDEMWRSRVVDPVISNAKRNREWLLGGGRDDCAEFADFLKQRVRLFGLNDRPTIDGIAKSKLTMPQYNVVQTLIEAGEHGLGKDELIRRSGHSDAIGILKRLADDDADWEHVISFARKPGGGYRIL